MIRSTVYNVLAWIVLVLGLILGFFAGSLADGVMSTIGQASGSAYVFTLITTWVVAIIIALGLFYMAASLHHLEEIDDNTNEMLKISRSRNMLNANTMANSSINDPYTSTSGGDFT